MTGKRVPVSNCLEYFGGDDYECGCGKGIVIDGQPQMETVYEDKTYSLTDHPAKFRHYFCSKECVNSDAWASAKQRIEKDERSQALEYKYSKEPDKDKYTVISGGLPSLGKRR